MNQRKSGYNDEHRYDNIKRVGYSLTEVAIMTGRNRTTIHRWLEKGVLRAIQVPGGKRMVQADSLDRLINGRPQK
jgi:excisionase family DNA binding protein